MEKPTICVKCSWLNRHDAAFDFCTPPTVIDFVTGEQSGLHCKTANDGNCEHYEKCEKSNQSTGDTIPTSTLDFIKKHIVP